MGGNHLNTRTAPRTTAALRWRVVPPDPDDPSRSAYHADVPSSPSPSDPQTPPLVVIGWKRWLFLLLGVGCVGLGYLGAIIPGLPMTPFLLVASYFFVRSSPRLHGWLRRSPWVGRVLRDWEEHRGVRRSVKITVFIMVVTAVTLTVAFSGTPMWARILVIALAALGLTVMACLPTVVRSSPLHLEVGNYREST